MSTILTFSLTWSQVNTESMRGDITTPGVNHNMTLNFSYFSGNSEIIQLLGTYQMNYLLKSNWYGLLSGKYNRAFEKGKEDFSNQGFVHLRTAKPIMAQTDIEGFIQKETNHFINLENRELLGSGLRINQFENLYWGTGIMHEMEKYNNISQEQNFIKSTNYINYTVNILNKVELVNVMYYQFKLDNPEDYRILWDGDLTIKASKGISFHTNVLYRFDKSIINLDGDRYFEISNGFGFHF
jgi:hypothetical protein